MPKRYGNRGAFHGSIFTEVRGVPHPSLAHKGRPPSRAIDSRLRSMNWPRPCLGERRVRLAWRETRLAARRRCRPGSRGARPRSGSRNLAAAAGEKGLEAIKAEFFGQPCAASIAVIHHDEFEIPEGLSLRRSQRPPQEAGVVLGGDDDAEFGLGQVGYGGGRYWRLKSLPVERRRLVPSLESMILPEKSRNFSGPCSREKCDLVEAHFLSNSLFRRVLFIEKSIDFSGKRSSGWACP